MSGQVDQSRLFPKAPDGFTMPFFYASLQSFWVYYLVETHLIEAVLPNSAPEQRLKVARFLDGDREYGMVSLDFQRYTGHASGFLEHVEEVEFNVYVYPEVRDGEVPLLSWQDYLMGKDQTKTVGGYRIHVPCNNPGAVAAGRGFYGEPKYLAYFQYTVPSPNDASVTTWDYSVLESIPPTPALAKEYPFVDLTKPGPLIYQLQADVAGVPTVAANASPLIEYGVNPYGSQVVVANFWNFFGAFQTAFLTPEQAAKVTLTLGSTDDPQGLRRDLQNLCANRLPVAVQSFDSPVVSAEGGPWFPVAQ
jgi:hypothetical protein